jgi:hypothetical protein
LAILVKADHAADRQFTDVPEQILIGHFCNFCVNVFPNVFPAGHIKITSIFARFQASAKWPESTDSFSQLKG